MTETNTIKQDIENYLTSLGVTWTVSLIGDDCPLFCADRGKPGIGRYPRRNHIHGQHYQLMLTRPSVTLTPKSGVPSKSIVIDYWNSYHDAALKHGADWETYPDRIKRTKELKDSAVSVADVLSTCEFHIADTFEDFADEFGYDKDSRKAEKVYRAVQDQIRDLRRMFTNEELSAVEEKAREL